MAATSNSALEHRPQVDPATLRAARRFLDLVSERYAVRDAYLFGSHARGAHQEDSDADVAVILRGGKGDRGAAIIDMAGLAFDVMMDCDIHVQVVPLWESEFDLLETCSNPALVRTVHCEGVKL